MNLAEMRTTKKEMAAEVAAFREKEGWKFECVVTEEGGLEMPTVFQCTLTRGRARFIHPYTKGWGNRCWRKRSTAGLSGVQSVPREQALKTWRIDDFWQRFYKPGQRVDTVRLPRLKKPEEVPGKSNQAMQSSAWKAFQEMTYMPAPTLEEFLGSLQSDADLVCHGETLDDFMGNTGWEGQEAVEAYNACNESWKALIRLGEQSV